MKQETEAPITEASLQDHIPLKNQVKPYYFTVIICLSTLYSGCCLTSSPPATSLPSSTTTPLTSPPNPPLSLLNGVLPAGGMMGALLVPSLVAFTTKK
jgi:hypothetical protein